MVSGSGGFSQPIGEYFRIMWWHLLSFFSALHRCIVIFPPQHGVSPLSDWAERPPFCHYRRNTVPTPSLSVAIVTTEPNQWRQATKDFPPPCFVIVNPATEVVIESLREKLLYSTYGLEKGIPEIMEFKITEIHKVHKNILV